MKKFVILFLPQIKKQDKMRKVSLIFILLMCNTFSFAQTEFGESEMERVQVLIMNREHDKADSILNFYQNSPQNEDAIFLINLTRCLNGYIKTKTYQDFSVIIPYAEAGKKAFMYIRDNINAENVSLLDCWPILTTYAEIFKQLNDSILCDIYKFSNKYYNEYGQKNLYSYYKVSLNTYLYHYYYKNEWKSAIDVMKDYNKIAIEAKDSSIMLPISSAFIGTAYLWDKNSEEAQKWFIDSYNRFQKFNDRGKCDAYSELLTNMAYVYNVQGDNDTAYKYALEAYATSKENYGKASYEYVNALGVLTNIEFALNKTDLGLAYMEEAVTLLDSVPNMSEEAKQQYRDKLNLIYVRLNIKNDAVDSDSKVTENTLIYEATNDFALGKIDDAISKFKRLLEYYNTNFQSVNLENYIFVATSLSNALVLNGNYIEADRLLDRTIDFLQSKNIQSQQLRYFYESKGRLYYVINNIDMALNWFTQAIDMYNINEEQSLQYALIISNIASCQLIEGNISLAKQLSEKAYEIILQFYGEYNKDANDRLLVLNNLANIYTKMNDISKGKEIYEKVIEGATSLQNAQTKALALVNLADIYLYENNLQKMEECIHEAKNLDAAWYIKEQIEMYMLIAQILQKKEVSVDMLDSYNKEIRNNLANVYEHFSEVEREAYWMQKSRILLLLNNISALTFDTPKTLRMAYDNTIYTKTMLNSSGRLLGELVKESNKDVQAAYVSMQNMKKRLCSKSIKKDSIETYRKEISQLEKRIIASIQEFGNKLKAKFKSYNDIVRTLNENEIAIEFVFLPKIKIPLNESEALYGALLLSKNDSTPNLIPLCSVNDLHELIDNDNSSGIEYIDSLYSFSDNRLYKLVWEKLEPYIPAGSTIYYSPTGDINKVNVSAISNGNMRLDEIYDFYEVSTTSQIDEVKQWGGLSNSTVALYGDINYYEDINMMEEKAKKFSSYSSGGFLATRSTNRGTWDLLPGTKEEVGIISDIMSARDLNITVYTQNDANEESFKAFSSDAPEIIHIATHGFYFTSGKNTTNSFFNSLHGYTQNDYAMFYSGLLFAGCNNVWTGNRRVEGVEDGILTADEISRLDLSNNKLIVLSACNTGLGDIDIVDGVSGLQRGLKIAGAKKILMSLWKVPDEETKELMSKFYMELLSGKTPHQSLKLAQRHMMDTGKSPYSWAGFILLD